VAALGNHTGLPLHIILPKNRLNTIIIPILAEKRRLLAMFKPANLFADSTSKAIIENCGQLRTGNVVIYAFLPLPAGFECDTETI
jgi:hypothetical protein